MAYNGVLEDSQNWLSVRYTASPYRKSKFPVDVVVGESSSGHWSNPSTSVFTNGGTNNIGNGHHHHQHHQQHNVPSYPFQYMNTNGNNTTNNTTSSSTGVGGPPYQNQQQHHQQLNNINNNTNNNHFYHHHYREYLPQQQQQQQDGGIISGGSILNETSQHHHHYGLPAPHVTSHSNSIPSSTANNCHFFMRYPSNFRPNCGGGGYLNGIDNDQLNQVEGILDEGYIEDLKQPYNIISQNNITRNNNNSSGNSGVVVGGSVVVNGVGGCENNNVDYDPYSYVYDSKIHEDLSVTSVLCCGGVAERDCTSSSVSMPMQYGGSRSLLALSTTRNGGGGSSENEYEEIRDVARYMNNNGGGGRVGGPLHFKSFSSTDDILAEVVQVQQGHDRVLDQLNLEVENLLISSTNDIVERGRSSCGGGGGSEVCAENHHKIMMNGVGIGSGGGGHLDKMSSLSLNGIYQECYCDEIPSLPQFGGTLNTALLRPGGGVGGVSEMNSLLLSKEVPASSCCCGTVTTRENGQVVRSRRSNSLTLNNSSNSHHDLDTMTKIMTTTSTDSFTNNTCTNTNTTTSGSCVSPSGNNCSSMIISRKKKLERQPNQLNDSSGNNHHHILPSSSSCSSTTSAHYHHQDNNNRHCKNRHHRSYSLIPHWKIREHLRRLPFLRQQHKLKKTEGSSVTASASTIPISSSGQDFATTNCLKMNSVVVTSSKSNTTTATNSTTMMTTTPGNNNKTRSSSMDELRATATEEHWYSADSDTEPDSLTALPESTTTSSSGGQLISNNCKNSDSSSAGCPITNSIGNTIMRNENGGSRFDIGSISDAPKAPKFRRGTAAGLKDKWRESWSSTKTLSKPNMDDENKLLRWFSLRKNQANIEAPGSRHSTLPLLSEEDLKRISYTIEDEDGYWPRRQVQPPNLPPPPPDLTAEQLTRRHIIAAIVHSENSYVAALQRLVNEYKKQLECSHPAVLSHSKISTIFHRVPEILQCHSLFRIALAECVRRWDADERIGDVFVASFSKSLVLDVYSEFINNFGLAMETAKLEARRKSAFADFLQMKQMTAHDRLSLFGLMVKPVQRFPQFILLLQDLLKHTPKDSGDRMSLQLALTQLESLAAMLNERKRESEQYQAFRETIKSIGGKFVLLRNITDDPNRILLRQDVVTQLEFDNAGGAVAKSKSRKLLLLNDMLICVALSQSGSTSTTSSSDQKSSRPEKVVPQMMETKSNGVNCKTEKSVFKFSYPVNEVEIEDISISPTMSRFVHNGSTKDSKNGSLKSSSTSGTFNSGNAGLNSLPEEVPISPLEEMQGLMYDYEVLSRILTLVSSLKSQYEGLTEQSVKELMLEIQHQIRCRDEQISYFDSSCLSLLLGSGNNRDKVVFQMQSPSARNEWIEELRLAQLALDPNNSPSWDIPSESPYPHHKLPLFVRSLSLTKSPHLITVKCGCFFTHTFVSPTGRSKILDYLWVSSTDGFSSHITSFRSQQNALKEVSSFDLVEEKINDLLFVSGHVWLATESRKIMLYDPNLADADKGSINSYLLSDSVLKLTLFEGCIYAGLADGTLAVFTQIQDPKILKPDHLIKIGQEKIPALFGSRGYLYAACGNAVVSIDIKTHTIERNVVLTHHNGPIAHMACSGVGLWITTQDSGTVCLYHLESLQHLQDVSIAPSVFRTVRDSFRRQKGCFVTCLTAHKGWLWIGTNLGVILTIPLPRLEGVPIISTGKANVSFHGYSGPVTFLMPLTKSPLPQLSTGSTFARHNKVEIIPATSESTTATKQHEQTTSLKSEESQHDNNKSTSLSFDESISSDLRESDSNNSSELKDGNQSTNSLTRTLSDTGSVGDSSSSTSKTLVVLRKKNSKDNVFMRNCKTLPRGGPLPSSLRFSVDSNESIERHSILYGLYGNLINVRGLEDEGRFVDPLYDALRRSDPELIHLDAKISTFDRRLKMRMSRPRSLDLSNWSVDSKISASSDESVGLGGARSSPAAEPITQDTTDSSTVPPDSSINNKSTNLGTGTTTKKTMARQKMKTKGQVERTVIVVVGGRGYVNMRNQTPDHFMTNSPENSDSKLCAHLTVWQNFNYI